VAANFRNLLVANHPSQGAARHVGDQAQRGGATLQRPGPLLDVPCSRFLSGVTVDFMCRGSSPSGTDCSALGRVLEKQRPYASLG